jgi:hypothetical protein
MYLVVFGPGLIVTALLGLSWTVVTDEIGNRRLRMRWISTDAKADWLLTVL